MKPAQWSCTKPACTNSPERTPPPRASLSSSTVTSRPRSASLHAHASPLWPPRTITTRGRRRLMVAACPRRATVTRAPRVCVGSAPLSESHTMADVAPLVPGRQRPSSARLLIPLVVALVIAGGVYLLTQAVTLDINTSLFGESATGTFKLKAWLASGVLALAAFQLYSALWIYGRLPGRQPGWIGTAHRASGYAALVLTLPIAYHCLRAYGFRDFDRRTVVHSVVGCFFYGAFAAKVIVVRSRRLPGWALPVAGGTMVTLVVVLWYSAALWYFNNFDSPGLTQSTASAPAAYPA